jgi:hypothetical protein
MEKSLSKGSLEESEQEAPPTSFETFQSGNLQNPEYVEKLLKIDKEIPEFIKNFTNIEDAIEKFH